MSALNLHIPITKIDAAKRLVYGVLTEEVPDRQGEILDYESSKPNFEKWSADISKASGGKSVGNLRVMHGNIVAGIFTDMDFDDSNKRISVCAKVVDDNEWNKVEAGAYTGFSVGGRYARRWSDADNPSLKRYTALPAEGSLVDLPAVPTATFECIKANGEIEIRKFHTEQTKEDLSMTKAIVDPNLEQNAPTNAPNILPEVKQGWLAKDNSFHLTKDSALKKNAEIEALGTGPAADAQAALKKLTDAVDQAEGKEPGTTNAALEKGKKSAEDSENDTRDASNGKDAKKDGDGDMAGAADAKDKKDGKKSEKASDEPYGDVEYADPGHQKDGKKRYPVDTAKHIRAAWNYINKEKNAAKYSAEQLKSVKAKIVSAWKSKIDKDGPPEAAKKYAKPEELQKGLHEVARAACLIQELAWLQDCIEWEAYHEEDDFAQPEKLKEIIQTLCDFLRDLVAEETSELAGGDDEDELVLAAGAGLSADQIDGFRKYVVSVQAMDPKQVAEAFRKNAGKLAEILEKAGARNSKSDLNTLKEIHDHASEVQKCCMKMGMKVDDESAEKAALAGELLKTAAQRDQFSKVLTDMIPQLTKLNDRIEHLEAQPLPAKGVKRLIGKGQDGGGQDSGAGRLSQEDLQKQLAAMDPKARNLLLMKASLANGISLAVPPEELAAQ